MLRQAARRGLRKLGFNVRRMGPGIDPYFDLTRLIGGLPSPVAFDVGANLGQTIEAISGALDEPTIHAFEPTPRTFSNLRLKYESRPGIHLNNVALGAAPGVSQFYENHLPTMNSFLESSKDCFGKVEGQIAVEIDTIDAYCARHAVDHIDFLKSDTQGFDLEVLKGAEDVLPRTRLVYLEVILSDMYKNAATFSEVSAFLTSRGFVLYALYDCHVHEGKAGWTDAMYINQAPSLATT